jgi:hypothetical protein
VVENEAEVQVVNKETARSWRSGSEEGTLEAPMLVQRGGCFGCARCEDTLQDGGALSQRQMCIDEGSEVVGR